MPPSSPPLLRDIDRGPSTWSTGGTEGESAPAPPVPPPNYIGTPSGLSAQGLGQFIDPSDALSTQLALDSAPSQPRDAGQTYSVDDMGITTQASRQGSSIGGAGPWGGSGGGRFATFPVKGGAGRGMALMRDDVRPAPATGLGTSSEADVVKAVNEPETSTTYSSAQRNSSTNEPPRDGRWQATDSIASETVKMPVLDPTFVPPPALSSPPPSVVSSGETPNPWDRESADSHQRSESDGSAHLAYEDETEMQREERMSRHVRFGGVSDVMEELKKREQSPATYQQEQGQLFWQGTH